MTNVAICPKCEKTLISEEFGEHECIPIYKPTKYIHVYYTDFFTVRNPDGSQSAVAEDKDGTIYLIDPTNRHLTRRKPTDDLPEPCLRFCKVHVGNSLCQKTSGD